MKYAIIDNKPFTTNNTYSTCASGSSLILIVMSLDAFDKMKARLVDWSTKSENNCIRWPD
jgi:hypothetical protein